MTYIYVHLQASAGFDQILLVIDGNGVTQETLPAAPGSDNAFSEELVGLVPGSYLTVTLRYDNDDPLNDPSGFFVDSVCEDSYGCMLMKKQSILLVLSCCSFC